MDKLIGKILDNRYEIIEVIGIGGMAIVYKAKCHRLNRYVALKVLKEEYAADEDFRRQFHDESQAVAMLSHPNIVSVYDVSSTDGFEYIVMELIDGITLKDYLSVHSPLPWKQVTFFSVQIAKALEHAHSRGIIHRDIKPQNIMLLHDGTVKVADFGIAHHMSNQSTYKNGEAIGSVHYVSPEQAKGSHVDNRTDIYSLGVVIYEMLTGRLPFEGDSPVSVALQHINSIALPPSDYVSGIPETLEAITMKAMNPSLTKRYANATQLLSDLENFKNDPEYNIKIDTDVLPAPHGDADEIDATRVLQNTGEVPPPEDKEDRRMPASERSRPAAKRKKASGFPASLLFSILACAIFFGGAIFFIIKVINPFGNNESDALLSPRLIGLAYAEVANDQAYADFTIVQKESIYNDADAGTIIAQEPEEGRRISKGDAISVTVSRGQRVIKLENYVDMEYRLAEADLSKKGLTVIKQEENSDEYAKDRIIRTQPAAEASLSSGDVVVIVVSLGAKLEQVSVPNLLGKTEADARAALTAAKLVCGSVTRVDSDKPDGEVIFQTIPARSTVYEGTIVDINISRNEPKIEEPPQPGGDEQPGGDTPVTPPMGRGTSYDPYPDSELKRRREYTISLIDAEEITVVITVNGKLEYEGRHSASEKSITVPLVAYEGYATINITQNGEVIYNETVEF